MICPGGSADAMRQSAEALALSKGHRLGGWVPLPTRAGFSAQCRCGRLAMVEVDAGRWVWSGGATRARCRVARMMPPAVTIASLALAHRLRLVPPPSSPPPAALVSAPQRPTPAAEPRRPRMPRQRIVRASQSEARARQVLPSVYVPPKGSIAFSLIGVVR